MEILRNSAVLVVARVLSKWFIRSLINSDLIGDVIFHAAKVVLLCDINMDNLSRKNSRIGRFVQFCILYLPKGIKNSPSSEELSEDHRISKLDYFPSSTPITL